MAARVKLAYDNGFQIASHTWAHEHLSTLTQTEGELELSLFLFSDGYNPFFSRFGDGTDRGLVFFFMNLDIQPIFFLGSWYRCDL